jgi:nonsense-mediated mRNA decay protein 3
MSSFATIACCLCGTPIPPNEAAMCLVCLRGQIDVTDGIGRNGEVVCEPFGHFLLLPFFRFNVINVTAGLVKKILGSFMVLPLQPFHHSPHSFPSELESPGLMALCLRKVTGMSKVKIIDAFWIWTEPHSKRLKVAMEIEKSVLSDKMALRQRVEIEYIIRNKQCLECIREASEHTWGSQIQLRQRVSTSGSSSLITLESALIKAGMHNLMLSIEVVKQGMNLYFKNKNQAEKVVNFISNLLPTRVKSSKKMISANKQNNTEKYEYVYLVDVVPLVKHDLVYLTKDHKLTSSPQLMIVEKLSSSLHLMNPLTLQRIEMTAMKYFALPAPLTALMNSKQLVPYILLDLEPSAATAQRNGVETLSDVTVVPLPRPF